MKQKGMEGGLTSHWLLPSGGCGCGSGVVGGSVVTRAHTSSFERGFVAKSCMVSEL